MRVFEYSPSELNKLIYEIQRVEVEAQKAKDDYEILEDTSKDLLASLVNQITSTSDISQVKAEAQARSSQEWKDFKRGLYEAQRVYGQKKIDLNHVLRCYEALINGMSFEKEKIKKGLTGQI